MFALWISGDKRFLFSDIDNGGFSVTDEQYSALMDGQSQGKVIVQSGDGKPTLADPEV